MRFLAFVLFLASPCLAGDPSAAGVRLTVPMGEGRMGCGSGTVVEWAGGPVLLTAAHVVPAGRPVTAWAGERPEAVEVLARLACDDVAVLTVPKSLGRVPVKVAEREPAAGAELRQWGHPGGSVAAVPKAGRLAGLIGFTSFRHRLLDTTIPARGGDSGAGVFDPAGELVGVCHGGRANAVPPDEFAAGLPAVRAVLGLARRTPCADYREFHSRVAAGEASVLVVGRGVEYRGERGYSAERIDGLSPGVYLCRWAAGGPVVEPLAR